MTQQNKNLAIHISIVKCLHRDIIEKKPGTEALASNVSLHKNPNQSIYIHSQRHDRQK